MQTSGALQSYSPELHSFFSQEGYRGLTQANALGISSRKSTDISLVTAEGDKVTISAKSSLQAEFASYDYRGRLHGNTASLQGRSLQVSAEGSFALEIEGNLSQEELDDIQKLVAKIEKLGSDFFSQPLESSLAKTLELGDLDSIASFAANLKYSRQLTAAHVVKEESIGAVAPTFDSAPASFSQDGFPAIAVDSVRNFIDQLLTTARDAKIDDEGKAEKLPKFLSQLFKKFAKELEFDEPKLKLAQHIQDKVAYALNSATERTPATTLE